MATLARGRRPTGWNEAGRRYGPMLLVLAVAVIAIWGLPSALNLPQANPTQVEEYAPVPNQSNSSSGGNFAGLNAGSSSTVGETGGGAPAGPVAQGQAVPSSYDCVGEPPRQTADPLSPPCVPSWHGDNGGSTWVGVTGKSINFVYRFFEPTGSCRQGTTYSDNCGAPDGWYDMDDPSTTTGYNADFLFTFLHYWSVYFNKHYQTYGRYVHFWIYNVGNAYTTNPTASYDDSAAAADAQTIWNDKHPFAVEDPVLGSDPVFTQNLAQHGVVIFGYQNKQLAAEYPGQYWTYSPPPEYIAQLTRPGRARAWSRPAPSPTPATPTWGRSESSDSWRLTTRPPPAQSRSPT